MFSIIVAKARNNIIGKDNKMLWKLPDDLKKFREKTSGHTIMNVLLLRNLNLY